VTLVPIDVQALSKVNIQELLVIKFIATNELVGVELAPGSVLFEDQQRQEIESISRINGNVNTIGNVDARFPSS